MNARGEIWVIDDDQSIRWVMERALTQEGMSVTCFASGDGVLDRLDTVTHDVVVSDIRMPGTDGLELL